MKVIAMPVQMVASFDDKGRVRPIKFRWMHRGENRVIQVDQIISQQSRQIAGTPMILFDCHSTIDDQLVYYQLKYDVTANTWILFKM
ncbi:MAG: hypothetical protein GX978_06385 [Tissierellia bacterium]|jgi:hypothetical protein|nr:hypothetical protein [Tissierellia bacterium]